MLEKFSKGRSSGLLFSTKNGTPLRQSYLREHVLTCGVPGMHSLRRYRTTWLEEQCCPRSLQAAWLGHSNSATMTDRYVKSAEDAIYRKKQCERIGTGLELAAATEGHPARNFLSAMQPEQTSIMRT
jgi:integrase